VAEKERQTYSRESVEFNRVLAFSDGVFAIAMTLLVVGIVVPSIADGDDISELADALDGLLPNVISFFISFAVIGRYWMAHHEFFGLLARIDNAAIGVNLLYLAFIAFLPFPTALLGTYFENPLSIVIYASTVAIVSGMEVVAFRHAYRSGLLRRPISPEVYRWAVQNSASPVVLFLLSIPIAFISTTLAACSWLLAIPLAQILKRWEPEGADELTLH
jgi:uncharacterized membrane protein